MENWLPICGYEGLYEISDQGRVKRLAGSPRCLTDRILRPHLRYGYPRVTLCRERQPLGFAVHHLVLNAFVGTRPEGHECNHINAVRDDNRLENLEWVTHLRNIQHAWELGRVIPHGCPGEKNGNGQNLRGHCSRNQGPTMGG